MKRLSLGLSAMLVTAVLAGAAGGAVALSATTGSTPAPQSPVTLHQVAGEATAAPSSSPTTTAVPATSATAVVDDAGTEAAPQAPVSDPAPIVDPVAPKGETASQAADRAQAEADRAKAEADRAAEKAASVPPTPAPQAPVEPKPECTEGETVTQPWGAAPRGASEYDAQYGGGVKTCKAGTWVQTKPNQLIEIRKRSEVQGEKTCQIHEKRVDRGPWQETSRTCNATSQEDQPEDQPVG